MYDFYWDFARKKDLPKIVEWLSQNTKIISQYAYYENYVFYVEKR